MDNSDAAIANMMTQSPNCFQLNREFYSKHADLLCQSYEQCIGQPLLSEPSVTLAPLEALFFAPFALVSHGTENDPIFNFGNQVALSLFEMTWEQFTALPSRQSAEPINRAERQRLLDCVSHQGYIDDYRGVRISSTGKRFLIEGATVWNLRDQDGAYRGQAAVFEQWSWL